MTETETETRPPRVSFFETETETPSPGVGNGSSQIVLRGLQFGQANDMSLDETLLPGDGVFGLGFKERAQYKLHCNDRNCNAMTPTLVTAAQQNAIEQSIFTVWIEKGVNGSAEVGGVVTLGAIDTKRCNVVDAYHPTVEWWPLNDEWGDSWIVQVDAVRVGTIYSQSAKQWTANIELSYPSLKVPAEVFHGIVLGVGGYFDPQRYPETPLIPCDAKNIPPIRLVIGGREYAQPVEPLVLPLAPEANICQLNVFTDGSDDGEAHTWTLNAAFAQAYCLVCDFGKNRIGFATPKNN
ncbi:aspartic protease 2B [Aphelenchoides avenae]|nr:aspartic protease 2B [Aphelenchus avenae]